MKANFRSQDVACIVNRGKTTVSKAAYLRRMSLALAVPFILATCGVAAYGQNTPPPSGCQIDTHAPQTRLAGTITDSSGDVIVGADVVLACGNFHKDTQTASDGTYAISVPKGNYELQIAAPGYASIDQPVVVPAGGSQQSFHLKIGRVTSIVSVTAPSGYVAVSSTTATKTGTPLIETPQSVSVVTLDQMTQRNVQTLGQAIEYTAGVGVDTYGADTRFDWFNIRGFDESTYGLFRDNSRWQSGQVEGDIEPYSLQEVDVIKGPSSVLYGQNTPGGLVNLVTKRPPSESTNEVIANFGSYDRRQFQEDLGGPLDATGHFRYRLTGLYRDSDTQVNYVPDNRRFIAPALTWVPSGKTTLTILTDYQHDNTGWSQFLPAQGTLDPNPNGKIPTSFFTGQPGFDYFHRQQWSTAYLFEHHFNRVWTIRQNFRYSKIAFDGNDAFGGGLEPDLKTLLRYGYSDALTLGLATVDTQAFAQFKTGEIEHSVLGGLDYSHANANQISGLSAAPPINVYAPNYNQTVGPPVPYLKNDEPSWQTGLYLQDHLKVTPKLIATLSGREDWTKLTSSDLLAKTSTVQNPSKFTGRTGITYLTGAGVAPYFSYSTSFLPTTGVNFYGKSFKPTTGVQYEGGLKYQPRHSHSFITASFFNITEHNVETPDPANPLNSLQTGAIRSRGVELEGVASILQGLDLHASYSYLDEKVTETTDPTQLGKRPTLIPNSGAGVLAHYTFSSGKLSGLGAGFGVRYTGTTAGDPANTFILPTYTLYEASLQYYWKNLLFQANATNLADRIYVPICTSISYCNYGNRRNVMGNVQYHWSQWHDLF